MEIAESVRLALLIVIFDGMCLILIDRKYGLKKTLIIYGCFAVAAITLNILIACLFGWRIFTKIYVIITNGCATIGLFAVSKRKDFSVVFSMFTATIFANASAMAGSYLHSEFGISVWLESLTRLIIGIPLKIILYRYLRPIYLQMLKIMKKGWGYLCLIPGTYYIIVIINTLTITSNPSEYRKSYLICFLALFITVVTYSVIFALFGRMILEAELRDEQHLLKLQMQAMERQADMLKKNAEDMRIYRHDLRHYIANLKVLLSSGNTEEALRILGIYEEQNNNATVPYYCDNPTVNAILVYYIQNAENEGITIETNCNLPKELTVEASELAMVLANAIENAIYACNRLTKDTERIIKIKLVSSPQLAIEIINSYADAIQFDENGLPISTEIGHGLGTKSIYAFVEKYDGIIEYNTDGKLFRMRLLVGT